MLISLHVKNFAIIDEVWVDFGTGLNVLTGETGAGKSILLGAVNMALGGRVGREILGKNADYALAELVFDAKEGRLTELLAEYDLPQEEQVVITRKLMENGRSVSRINGETVSQSVVREAAACLIDIHGQHEHQSLLYRAKHLELLDRFAKEEAGSLPERIRECFQRYRAADEELTEALRQGEGRVREMSMLEYETQEISAAGLRPQEDAQLEQRYQELCNANRIREAATLAQEQLEGGNENASELLGRALRQLSKVSGLSEELSGISEELSVVEEQVGAVGYRLSRYLDDLSDTAEEFAQTEERLDLINRLKSKYGRTIEEILAYGEQSAEKLAKYQDYDGYVERLQKEREKLSQELSALCGQMTEVRRRAADVLSEQIRQALLDLNFLDVAFSIAVEPLDAPTEKGRDEVEFRISTNPGEPLRPLAKVASGGELSRIMLALKSVFAGKDEIETLIFDEIDVGVSGRTAQKVAEKMARIACRHQVLCITHLPQIAAMGDTHFRISKKAVDGAARTEIAKLSLEEQTEELARILGGARITDSVRKNASEMKELAQESKRSLLQEMKG
ncbi:MAG: DNA repair protein RecN [Lachnospiraceae bacterium]|nr:DNA repair protein RecN [Lachnospiraceae bacterium]